MVIRPVKTELTAGDDAVATAAVELDNEHGTQCAAPLTTPNASCPTVWGLSPMGLHDYFWAARGVCVVRQGERTEIPEGAELYLLTDADTYSLFGIASVIDLLSWVRPSVLFIRLAATRNQDYREVVVTDAVGRFERFRRLYGWAAGRGAARLALTRDRGIAAVWQSADSAPTAWKQLRKQARTVGREVAIVQGHAYSRQSERQMASLADDLLRYWDRPSATVSGIQRIAPRAWAHDTASVGQNVRFISTVWIGAGRSIEPGTAVLGPAILWDDPDQCPSANKVLWSELEPTNPLARRQPAARRRRGPRGKRLFDIVAALLVLVLTLPFYPLIMLAIWIESGRPFFFAHRRQTLGGREFYCIKFRSMRRDAEQIKRQMSTLNSADGPQFYFVDDPRLTRVGKLLRKTHIDELPQFINVLLGDMSVVGPRPSPASENQFNPAWREARLSVRAGVTGLWQVRRTRRPGLDFQEWIKYDLEYVQNASWWMDLGIILRTAKLLLGGKGK